MNFSINYSTLRNALGVLFFTLLTIIDTNAQCTYTQIGQLSGPINFRSIIDCPGGDVTLNDMNSHPNGSGNVIFDQDVTLNSLTINFASGNKPVEFIIPAGVTVTILTNLTFNGQPDKDKFLTVDGTLIVGGTLDFGGLEFEVDGEGSIDADDITGADNVSCADSGVNNSCPTITADTCDDGSGGDFCDTALPVDLLFFSTEVIDNAVSSKWATVTEENNDFFSLERSKDGLNYEVIATIDGAGNSTDVISYEFIDQNPLFGQSYYRLKQTDFDGASETFGAKRIYISSLEQVVASPNPVERGGQLNLFSNAEEGEEVISTIYNTAGVAISSIKLAAGNNEIDIDNQMEPGFYILKVKSGDKQLVQRLLVK